MRNSAAGNQRSEAWSGVAIVDWLAGIFSAPMSPDSVAACRSVRGITLLAAIGDEAGSRRGTDLMQAALVADDDVRTVACRLARAYTLLFEGPGGPKTVSIYESAYSGESPRLCQSAMAEMDALLGRGGMSTRSDLREPADHLSIELALLAELQREGDLAGAGALSGRLLRWVPLLSASCVSADATGFYGGASIVLHDLLIRLGRRVERSPVTASTIQLEEHYARSR